MPATLDRPLSPELVSATDVTSRRVNRIQVTIFAVTVFLSAFLLFQVQPLTSKFILPWFGGSPAVWTAAMLFYQLLLFGGYLYAHCSSSYLSGRMQCLAHIVVLIAGAAVVLWLRITPPSWLRPLGGGSSWPLGEILGLLTITAGVPYFALSATGPLLQKWFSESFVGISPYRLFALSNAGSLLALLSYPFVVEVYWGSSTQAVAWSAGFLVFAMACGYCALSTRTARASSFHAHDKSLEEQPAVQVAWFDRFAWLWLPTLASVMFLAVTNEVCQNVTTVPLLWIVPLSLYLLTFIVAFDQPHWYRPTLVIPLAIVATVIVANYDYVFEHLDSALDWMFRTQQGHRFDLVGSWALQSIVYFGGFFLVAMVCHGELARRKPPQTFLTQYYLTMSAGGAVGGILVNLLAPNLFATFFEFPLGLFVSLGAMLVLIVKESHANATTLWRRSAVLLSVGALLVVGKTQLYDNLVADTLASNRMVLHEGRNFFGTVSVQRRRLKRDDENFTFYSGHIPHGKQLADPARRGVALTYYGEGSGIEQAIRYVQHRSPQCRIGVVGLGIGTLAAYGREHDSLRFYEINPEVAAIARNTEWFHYLADCPSDLTVVLGDARLQLELELSQGGSQQFDVLCLDAFSGDAVPSHLLTSEAIALYKQHLAPDGILALHITNTHLNLYPVVKGLAEYHGFEHVRIYQHADHDRLLDRNYYVLLSTDKKFIQQTPEEFSDIPETLQSEIAIPLWTDEYHNLWQLLR